jgi:hypothetical protein
MINEEELNKLAAKIVKLIFDKQEEYENQFKHDIENMLESQEDLYLTSMTKEEMALQRIETYKLELKQSLAMEDYARAQTITDKIEEIKIKFKL